MPSLPFNKRFAPKICSGEKRQTIRAVGKRVYRPGQTLYFFTGMRTKACKRLGWAKCTSVEIIRRKKAWAWECRKGRRWLPMVTHGLFSLSREDGFEVAWQFEDFFARYRDGQVFYVVKWDKFHRGKPCG